MRRKTGTIKLFSLLNRNKRGDTGPHTEEMQKRRKENMPTGRMQTTENLQCGQAPTPELIFFAHVKFAC